MKAELQNPSGRATMNKKPVIVAPVKTIINFESGFKEKLLCDGPTFSSGTSCAYTCSYCYVPAIMAKNANVVAAKESGHTHEGVVIRRKNAVEIVRQQLTNKDGSPKFRGNEDGTHPMATAHLHGAAVIYASPLVDVAANMELVHETVEICKLILTLTNWHIRLLSKSNLLPKIAQALSNIIPTECPKCHCVSEQNPGTKCIRDHTGCDGVMIDVSKQRVIYGVSTGTLDDKLAKAIEPDCPLVSKRIESLHWLQDNGYRTFGMICPSLPSMDYQELELFSRDMGRALRYPRCEHIWAEVMNVRGESMMKTIEALNAAGYGRRAAKLKEISEDKMKWERYARDVFESHASWIPISQLRYLQYVNKENLDYWKAHKNNGAVLLGKAAHE